AKEVWSFENQMESRKKQLGRSRKWAGDGSRGRGTKTRVKPITRLRGKIADFKKTKNHQWSRFIIDYAAKNGVGIIQMEDLSGVATDKKLLRTWNYYDLQQKITYKAEEYGIHGVKVNPKHTSSRCSYCGAIHRSQDKQIWRNQQTNTFTCMNCDHQGNADLNAAKNLSLKGIDEIIEQEKEEWLSTI